ncbi:hypothetical protein [Liberiplasma polymorphum]|uniref:hypothetical protein n=1 Tax=Liberiplasma polymorphum TaxID=3374570 RepID=UPI003773DBF8
MIAFAKLSDFEQILNFVIRLNKEVSFNSGYMSLDESSLRTDIYNAIETKQVYVSKDDVINGIIFFHENKEHQTYDVAGPYVKQANISIGLQLINHLISQLKTGYHLQFFFNDKSVYYKELMQMTQAIYKGNEFILNLRKHNFKKVNQSVEVTTLNPEFKEAVKVMHDTIFPGVYITGEDVVRSDLSKTVYVLIEEKVPIGYALIKVKKNKAMLEVFAITHEKRGNKLSKPFISEVIACTYKDITVDMIQLVVENINARALKVYLDMGFEIDVENSTFDILIK